MPSALAISLFVDPAATHRNTCNSRAVRRAAVGGGVVGPADTCACRSRAQKPVDGADVRIVLASRDRILVDDDKSCPRDPRRHLPAQLVNDPNANGDSWITSVGTWTQGKQIGDVDPRIRRVIRREAGHRRGPQKRFGVQADQIGVLKTGADASHDARKHFRVLVRHGLRRIGRNGAVESGDTVRQTPRETRARVRTASHDCSPHTKSPAAAPMSTPTSARSPEAQVRHDCLEIADPALETEILYIAIREAHAANVVPNHPPSERDQPVGDLPAVGPAHPYRCKSPKMFDANTTGGPLPRLMNAIRTPSLVVAYCIGRDIMRGLHHPSRRDLEGRRLSWNQLLKRKRSVERGD